MEAVYSVSSHSLLPQAHILPLYTWHLKATPQADAVEQVVEAKIIVWSGSGMGGDG